MMHQIPNVLTILRILLIFPFGYLLFTESYQLAFIVFVIAGVSDAVDGFLARQFQWRSRFGAIADPIADKLLLITTYVALTWLQIIPLWLVLLMFGRDLLIVVGGLLFHYRIHRYEIQPSIWGKLCTFTQIAFVVLVLLHLAGYASLQGAITAGVYGVALITLASGLHYTVVWIGKARKALEVHDN